MVALLPVVLIQALFLISEVTSKRTRTPCPDSFRTKCDDGTTCLLKHEWCDGQRHCGDGSDEKYCSRNKNPNAPACNEKIHFICEDNSKCIPIDGYCDGYSACPDMSDERDCPCEVLREREGTIEYEAFIGQYRTMQKCWTLEVKKGQELTLTVESILHNRDCNKGNVSIEESSPGEKEIFCPSGHLQSLTSQYDTDVKIHYSSSWYVSGNNNDRDFTNFTYNKIDLECKNPQSFKCDKYSCLLPEKQCDGIEDCENGLDEKDCEKNPKYVARWMKNQHDADWGWKENTHRAIVALYLGKALNLNKPSDEDELIVKQLELEVSTYLFRSEFDKLSATELSAYINALLVICHNPRNFYGFDLISKLKEELKENPGYATPFPYLTLCNAKESISQEAIDGLLQNLEKPLNRGFILEIQALTVMTLSCISRNYQYCHLKQNITDFLNKLKEEKKEDGSFGNEYTTALVLQALIACDQANEEEWKFNSSVEFLRKKQKEDGSFGDFLTTYLIMPVLNTKSLIDVGKVNCTESMKRPKEGNKVSDIKSKLGNKIPVKYSIVIGDEKDQILPIFLRIPGNITVLELMTLAADVDPKYKFKTHKIKGKTYVYEISGIPNDPEKGKFWFLNKDLGNGTISISQQSPDEVRVGENDHIVMWYRTLIV